MKPHADNQTLDNQAPDNQTPDNQDRPVFPFKLSRWDAKQLTDAVPLRLFEAINFQALHYGHCDASANDPRVRPRKLQSYLPNGAFSEFRVR